MESKEDKYMAPELEVGVVINDYRIFSLDCG